MRVSAQAVISGKPVICLSSNIEQMFNGIRLEELRLAKHFTIIDVLNNKSRIREVIVSEVEDWFNGGWEIAHGGWPAGNIYKESAQKVEKESKEALPALAEALESCRNALWKEEGS